MENGVERAFGRSATKVSADDVVRVVSRALTERTWRIRLTSGQRGAILHAPMPPGVARP